MPIDQSIELQHRHEARDSERIHHGPATHFLDDAVDACLRHQLVRMVLQRGGDAPGEPRHLQERDGETRGEDQESETKEM